MVPAARHADTSSIFMSLFFLILGALALSAALVWLFTNPSQCPITAYLGAWAMMKSGYAPISSNELFFWAIAVIILLVIQGIRSIRVITPLAFRAYLGGGALACTFVGTLIGHAGMTIGAVCGVFIAAVAYMRLRRLGGRRYWLNVLAVGFPDVVSTVLMAITVTALISRAA